MWGWALALVLLVQAWPLSGQLISPGKLARPHAGLEGVGNCTQCHTPGERVDDGKCLACHDKLAARIRAGKGYHVHFAERRCADCHSDHRGVEYEMVRWNPERFDHDSTGYALQGGHARVRCDQCHKTSSFLGLERDCLSCHADTHQGQLAADCLICHTYEGWKPVTFDHGRARFLLRGKHAAVACGKCHADGRYREIPFGACRDCHADTHQGQLAPDCLICHTYEGWKPVTFDHDRARFPLLGKHGEVRCEQCHRLEAAADGPFRRYRPLAFARCSDCHRDPHRPSLGADCERCHVVGGWKGTRETFDHQQTRFPLRGKHGEVPCERCHAEGRFRGLEFGACRDCHADGHRGQLAGDCGGCHAEGGWKPVTFDHDRARFPLRGKHGEVRCERCHPLELDAGGGEGFRRYRPLGMACRDCHADVHRGQLAEDCAGCHGESGWKPSSFDHARARYQLDGKHVAVPCEQCHPLEMEAGGEGFRRYRPLETDCAACHR